MLAIESLEQIMHTIHQINHVFICEKISYNANTQAKKKYFMFKTFGRKL